MGLLGNLLKGLAGPEPTGEHHKVAVPRAKAEAGDKDCQYSLGLIYGGGAAGRAGRVQQDYVQSAKRYGKAAEQDHHAAQLCLGICLPQGKGAEQDVVEGLKWISLAKRGNPWERCAANETQGRPEALMTEQQIAEARVMALMPAAERGE
ncbi:MAG: hypothetical protein ABSH34_09590 [Verrucomicrobiota bacterium]|jgi:TPR repeat protein